MREVLARSPLPFFYVNHVGAQNNGKNILVFDGDTTAYDAEGAVRARATHWREELLLVGGEGSPVSDSQGEIEAIHEIGMKQRIMKEVRSSKAIRPHRQLLGQATVVRVGSVTVLEPCRRHQLDQTPLHVFVDGLTPCEEIYKQATLNWRVGMQGEVRVDGADFVLNLQSSNAPGAQVAPGSHEICEDPKHLGR